VVSLVLSLFPARESNHGGSMANSRKIISKEIDAWKKRLAVSKKRLKVVAKDVSKDLQKMSQEVLK
jgi:hypothetical protein